MDNDETEKNTLINETEGSIWRYSDFFFTGSNTSTQFSSISNKSHMHKNNLRRLRTTFDKSS